MTGSIAYTRSSTRLPQTLGSNPIPLHSRPAPTLKHNHESIIFWSSADRMSFTCPSVDQALSTLSYDVDIQRCFIPYCFNFR